MEAAVFALTGVIVGGLLAWLQAHVIQAQGEKARQRTWVTEVMAPVLELVTAPEQWINIWSDTFKGNIMKAAISEPEDELGRQQGRVRRWNELRPSVTQLRIGHTNKAVRDRADALITHINTYLAAAVRGAQPDADETDVKESVKHRTESRKVALAIIEEITDLIH